MTREKFIKKWLGNKDYQYTEQNRDLMRDDLDEVINQALRQPPVSGQLEAIRNDFCLWYYAQSQPLYAHKVVDWFASNLH